MSTANLFHQQSILEPSGLCILSVRLSYTSFQTARSAPTILHQASRRLPNQMHPPLYLCSTTAHFDPVSFPTASRGSLLAWPRLPLCGTPGGYIAAARWADAKWASWGPRCPFWRLSLILLARLFNFSTNCK